MHHPEVTGMEPAARESLCRSGGVVVIPLHDVVAAHDDLAHFAAVGFDVDQHSTGTGLVAYHAQTVRSEHADSLSGQTTSLFVGVQFEPLLLCLAHRIGTVGFGEAVDVHERCSQCSDLGDDRRARRSSRCDDGQRSIEWMCLCSSGESGQHGRRTGKVIDAVVDGRPDGVAAHSAKAYVCAGRGCDRPRGAPPVAVEHRQRP